jgi:GMP synthase (glutamine-hydrolysing)
MFTLRPTRSQRARPRAIWHTGAVKSLLVVRNEAADTLGLAPSAFDDEGLPVTVVDAWDPAAAWPEVPEVSGLAVFGGSMNCDQTDAYPYLARVRTLLREANDVDLPVLGVCLGAQLLARALGFPVVRAPRRELGFPEIELTEAGVADPVLGALPPKARMFQWHEDAFPLPAGAELLARGEDEGVQAFRRGWAWGVQFHPEVTRPELEDWFSAAGSRSLESVWGRSPEDLREELAQHLPQANRYGADLFARFARQVHARSERAA